jgi:exonuclease VII small subunit
MSDTEPQSDSATTSETKTTELTRVDHEVPEDQAWEIEHLPPPLKEGCEELQPIIDETVQTVLLNKYRIGEIVSKAGEEMDKHASNIPGRQKYKVKFVEYMATALRLNKRTLSDCLRLVHMYGREEYQELITNARMTWEHVLCLLNAGGEPLRIEMQQKIEEEGWTTNQVRAEVRARVGNQRSGTGRPPGIPKNLNEAFFRLDSSAVGLTRRIEDACFCDEFDITEKLLDTPLDEITEQTLVQVNQSKDKLRSAEAATQRGFGKLEEAETRIERILQHREEEENEEDRGDQEQLGA